MSTSVAERFRIAGSVAERPDVAGLVIYADGGGVPDGADPARFLELSHWVPNVTPARYKADTSTEICLNYAADPARADADLVVNNHVDIDGVLSLYALVHSDLALAHRETLVGAAAMGDFLAWPGEPGFRLAQHLALVLTDGARRGVDAGQQYQDAFDRTTAVLTGTVTDPPEIEAGWQVLQQGRKRLADEVTVTPLSERLVSFVYPGQAGADLDRALGLPGMNAVVDDSLWLWPEVRNEHHGEQVQLVAVPHDSGWFYDLWLPGYAWAETPDRWTVPGLALKDSNSWLVEHEPLAGALADLNRAESGAGRWQQAERVTPFLSMPGRQFPVVASCVDPDGHPAPSTLDPDQVAEALTAAW